MKVLLTSLNAKYIHPNLAIRILYQQNKRLYKHLYWREFTIKESTNDITNFCLDYPIIAFSCYIWNITQTLAVCEALKAQNPAIYILLGGPEVSYEYNSLIKLPYIDAIIAGEGETAFESFLKHFPNVAQVPNLIWKKDNGIVKNATAPLFPLEKLSGINPYADDDINTLKTKVLYIETTRGCPYKCEFCLASLDNQMRYLPMVDIKNQLLYLMQHGKTIKFLDRTFNIKKAYSLEIFEFILQHHRPENVFQFEITADILHPDIIAYIKEKIPKGLFRFEIGIQSADAQVNLSVNRKQSFEKTEEIIVQIKDFVELHLDLIVGLPLETWDGVKNSFEKTFRLFAPELQLGFLKYLKGTPIKNNFEHRYIFDNKPPYEIIESKYLSSSELSSIKKLEQVLEIYWNKKRTIYTLKYITARYSVFDFLIDLGKFFEQRASFHKHSLEDIFFILDEFIKERYVKDLVLRQLVHIDFLLYHKIRPKDIFNIDYEKKRKYELLEKMGENIRLYRHFVMQIDFDFEAFKNTDRLNFLPQNLVFRFDGKTEPLLLQTRETK